MNWTPVGLSVYLSGFLLLLRWSEREPPDNNMHSLIGIICYYGMLGNALISTPDNVRVEALARGQQLRRI
jgi:hypothetical protein